MSELFSERGLIREILSTVTIRAKGSVFPPCLNCALAGKTRWNGVSWMELPSKSLHTTFYSTKDVQESHFHVPTKMRRPVMIFFALPHCRSFNIRRTKKQDDLIREIKPRRLPTLLSRNNTNEWRQSSNSLAWLPRDFLMAQQITHGSTHMFLNTLSKAKRDEAAYMYAFKRF